jgi:hypothetical protein
MRWAECVAYGANNNLIQNIGWKNSIEDLGTDGRIILKEMFCKNALWFELRIRYNGKLMYYGYMSLVFLISNNFLTN